MTCISGFSLAKSCPLNIGIFQLIEAPITRLAPKMSATTVDNDTDIRTTDVGYLLVTPTQNTGTSPLEETR